MLLLGFRSIDGFREEWSHAIVAERHLGGLFVNVEELGRRVRMPQADNAQGEVRAVLLLPRALRLLADADACGSIGLGRRTAAWEVRRMPGGGELPFLTAARARELATEPDSMLPVMPLSEEVVADYQTTRLSLKRHPLHFLRQTLRAEGILSGTGLFTVPDGGRAKVAGRRWQGWCWSANGRARATPSSLRWRTKRGL